MKQIEIINKLPATFAECKGINVALLIGSFARKQTTCKSDIDYSLWIDKTCFNPNQLCELLEKNLPAMLKMLRVELRNKIIVYFSDCPKLELNWYEQLSEINRNYLGSEIENIAESIVFTQSELEVDIEKYLNDITAAKKQSYLKNGIVDLVKKLTDKFIYEFESASHSHKRSDSYKFYFFYNIALDVAIKLNYLSMGKTEHYYLPKNFSNFYKQEELDFFRGLSGTLYLPEANKKKRDLLDFFYKTIEKLEIHNQLEINAIKEFLEFVYVRDFIWNFRDLAMLNTKMKAGKIFRSSALTRYQNEPFFADFIQKYKITKVVDLRNKDEYAENPYTEGSLQLFEHLYLSIDPYQQSDEFVKNYHYGTDIQIAYRHYAVEHKHIFRAIFEQIDPEKDVFLIHCHAGKDRTGCVVALFGLLVGETIENIQNDYFESEMDTDIENLNAFLEIIEQEGGVNNFLLNCGISQDCINYWKIFEK
jgi:protein tyrosine/serine phosphatase/predicted nucleotidyltransferase